MSKKFNQALALTLVLALSISQVSAFAAKDEGRGGTSVYGVDAVLPPTQAEKEEAAKTNPTTTPTTPSTEPSKPLPTLDTSVINKEGIFYKDALELMYKMNNELNSIQKQIVLQDDVIKEADIEAKKYKGHINEDKDKALDRARTVYIVPLEARNTKADLIRSLADKKITLREQLMQDYINYKTYQSQLDLNKQILTVQQKDYNTKAAQYKLGKLSTRDLANAELSVQLAKKDVDSVQRKMDLLLLDFNVLINNSYQLTYKPDAKSLDEALKVPNLNFSNEFFAKLVAANTKNDSQLAQIKEQVSVIEEQKRIEHVYGTGTDFVGYEKNLKKNDQEQLTRTLAVEYQAYSDYYTMKTYESDIASANDNLKFLNLKYSIAETQLKTGYITELELIKAKKDIQSAEYTRLVSMYNLYNLYNNFLKYVSEETTKTTK